jgi:MoxR-like ATPase
VTTPRTEERLAPAPEGYSWPELHRLVSTCLHAGLSVLLRGHPGVGKSALAARLADDLGLPLIDIRLAQRDPADLCGVWFPDRDAAVLSVYPPRWAIAAAERPALIFLDEINAAVTKLHQAAAYQLVLERRVGELQLHPDTLILAAGNLQDDEAIVTPLSSALNNRFVHFVLRADAPAWVSWARDAGLHPAVVAYIERHGVDALYAPAEGEPAFPTPRAWEMLSRALTDADARDHRRLAAACVGVRAGERFYTWQRVFESVRVDRLIGRGETVDFQTGRGADPSFAYAVMHAVGAFLADARSLSASEAANVVRFLRSPGLDAEYAFLCLRLVRRNTDVFAQLRSLPSFRDLARDLVGLHPLVVERRA